MQRPNLTKHLILDLAPLNTVSVLIVQILHTCTHTEIPESHLNLDACIDLLCDLREPQNHTYTQPLQPNESILVEVKNLLNTTQEISHTFLQLISQVNSRCEEMQEPPMFYLVPKA